jgi:hypothetical protein
MDMRPQNVFYAPKTGEVSIIDIGDFCAPREATQRHPPLDIHDMLLDLVRWHLPANDPPLEIDSWTRYAEPLRSPQFEGAVDDTRRLFSNEDLTDDRALAMRILDRIKARGYSGVSEFKTDAQEFFELRRQRITSSPALPAQMELWKQGVAMMRDDYWSKFLFSGGLDLSTYTGSD